MDSVSRHALPVRARWVIVSDAISSIRRVLVVYKASRLDRYRDRGTDMTPPQRRSNDVATVYERVQMAHQEHEESVARVEELLGHSGFEIINATQPRKRDAARADLVVTVGGDGTFLWTARRVENTPILGVNSSPAFSTGHYCAATAASLGSHLQRIASGEATPDNLVRIRPEIDGRRVPYAALNDVLLAHRSPAGSSRYLLRIGDLSELHVSSGLWCCTASGSSGAMRSAGGQPMHVDDGRLQWRVRELYRRDSDAPESQLAAGLSDNALEIVSRSPSNAIYLDGASVTYNVGFAVSVTLRRDTHPLRVYGYREQRHRLGGLTTAR